jgi:hypothetical protein
MLRDYCLVQYDRSVGKRYAADSVFYPRSPHMISWLDLIGWLGSALLIYQRRAGRPTSRPGRQLTRMVGAY